MKLSISNCPFPGYLPDETHDVKMSKLLTILVSYGIIVSFDKESQTNSGEIVTLRMSVSALFL
jgi:hypothetical protein